MPFKINITINSRQILSIDGYNAGPPSGDYEEPTRLYRYTAHDIEKGTTKSGEVLHERPDGIEMLSSLILQDVCKTSRGGSTYMEEYLCTR